MCGNVFFKETDRGIQKQLIWSCFCMLLVLARVGDPNRGATVGFIAPQGYF